nr:hypothetical protein [Candidatus Liberibacter solanacearum]
MTPTTHRTHIDAKTKSDHPNTNTANPKRKRKQTENGKENKKKAKTRDILACGMTYATKAGYTIVLTVHDEIVCETPDTPEFSSDNLCTLMTQNPEWAKGLPLKAEGYEALRYRK